MGKISKEHALEILKEAERGGFLKEEIPTDDKKIVSYGEYYAEEAMKAYEDVPGMKRNKTVKAIINIYKDGVDKMTNAQEAVDEIFGTEPHIFRGLPIPEDLPNDPVSLPTDFTEIGDVELRRLHGEFNAYLARAKWMLSVTINQLSDATHLRDEAYRRAYLEAHNKYTLTEQKVTSAILDAEAKDNPEYKEFDSLVRKHQNNVTSYKALTDIYGGDVDRLSREWTMRTDETRRAY